ncbi:Bax inhibitor-1/YccA family protein [Desulfobotulus sp.]|jgi:FtsH-binding integral membrane protein|uniref:Bax inhibitor-1/YccA family protein n=1 Tax=Desulfobotulus sp. TaxID=1940337 RepID=UPI002A363ADC|nr:Bax inhibitor-1/YccA family protein [Desulfobotulus sp.]MDY0161774.1 Bax inhibitor-1/YccA family protein [Desulfobotulus sp.]
MEKILAPHQSAQVRVNGFIQSVYNWMAIGLAVTGGLAYFVSEHFIVPPGLFFILVIAQLGMVFVLAGKIQSLSASTATSLFVLYAALNGVTLSWIFLVYAKASIVSTFFICALTFAAASVYGMVTKKDLTSFGGFLMMGLIGIIIASLVNLFFRSSAVSMIVSYVGVFVFIGLTAWDTQKIKQMALAQPADLDNATLRKGAIFGALSLYLDFINLFIMMLRIFGDRD